MEGLYKTDTIKCRLPFPLPQHSHHHYSDCQKMYCVLDPYSTTVTPQTPSLQKPHSITILSEGKFLDMKPPTLQLALRALGADKSNIRFITPKNLRHVSCRGAFFV